jgi:hypothetical protein
MPTKFSSGLLDELANPWNQIDAVVFTDGSRYSKNKGEGMSLVRSPRGERFQIVHTDVNNHELARFNYFNVAGIIWGDSK